MRLVLGTIVSVLLIALVAATWDFTRFVDRAERAMTPVTPAGAQAVTALTGASNARIVAGVKLAEKLRVPLLISGVHVDTTPGDIAEIVGVTQDRIDCCVTLGRAAATTEGNGAEVAEWARRMAVTRVVVVTSEYHMDRAMLELQRAMPEAEFIPHAVPSLATPPRDWWRDPDAAKRLLEEWAKYRVASLRAANTAGETASARSLAG